ncbi:MAG: NAD-dependent epimerase/dehydratase family protein, partial [Chitinivibrionales bacterium]
MKKVLITGINGFIGHHITERLIRSKGCYHVFGIDMQEKFASCGAGLLADVEYNSCDLTDSAAINLIIRGIQPDIIIHLAALLGNGCTAGQQKKMVDVNVGGTLNILNAVENIPIHLLFPSTGLIYGNQPAPYTEDMPVQPANFYALTKKMAEDAITFFTDRYSLKATIFRPSVVFGAGQQGDMFIPSIIKSLLHKKQFAMTPGEQRRDFVFVEDVAAAFESAMQMSKPGVYNIGSGKSIKMAEAAQIIQKKCGRKDMIKAGALPYRDNECWEYSLAIAKA